MWAEGRITVQVYKLALKALSARRRVGNDTEFHRRLGTGENSDRSIDDGIGKCNCQIIRKAVASQGNRHHRLTGIAHVQFRVRWTGGREPAPQRIDNNRVKRIDDRQNALARYTGAFTGEIVSRLENYLACCAVDQIVRIRAHLIRIGIEGNLEEMVLRNKFGIHYLYVQRARAQARNTSDL